MEACLQDRNITTLVHFTQCSNIESILKHGIVPRNLLQKFGIEADMNDVERVDGKKNCSSISISFPNGLNFYSFQCRDHSKDWCVIEIDPQILIEKSDQAYFCYTNASHVMPKTMNENELKTINAFNRMYEDPINYNSDYYPRWEDLDINNTTDVQAEILVEGIIDKEYIKKICFKDVDAIIKYNDIRKVMNIGKVQKYFYQRADHNFHKEGDSNGDQNVLYPF